MAGITLTLRTRFAWWARPALAVAAVVQRISPRHGTRLIGAIIDRGVTIDAV